MRGNTAVVVIIAILVALDITSLFYYSHNKKEIQPTIESPGSKYAKLLPKDMLALTLAANSTANIAATDQVDILLTRASKDKPYVSETLLQNIRVLGVDAQMVKDKDRKRTGQVVTLAVTEKQAQTLVLASQLGSLNLVVLSQKGVGGKNPYTFGSNISQVPEQDRLTVIRGSQLNEVQLNHP